MLTFCTTISYSFASGAFRKTSFFLHTIFRQYFHRSSLTLSILFCSCPPIFFLYLLLCFSFSFSFSFFFFSPFFLVNTSSLYPSTVCVPISFNVTGPDKSLVILPELVLIAPVLQENTLAKGSQRRDVYFIKDGKLHNDDNDDNNNDNFF